MPKSLDRQNGENLLEGFAAKTIKKREEKKRREELKKKNVLFPPNFLQTTQFNGK